MTGVDQLAHGALGHQGEGTPAEFEDVDVGPHRFEDVQ